MVETVVATPAQNKSLDPQDEFFAQSAINLGAKKAAEDAVNNPPAAPDVEPVDIPSEPVVKDEKAASAEPEKATPPIENKPIEFNEAEVLASLELEDIKPTESSTKNEPQNEEIESYRAKASEYDALLSDKEIKALLEAKKNGKSMFDLVKEIQGEDYSKLSDKELFENDLKNYSLSDDDRAIAIEKFNGMLPQDQRAVVNKIKGELDAKRSQLLEQYKSASNANEQILQVNRQKAHARLNELREKKAYNNLELTAERWQKIDDYMSKIQPDENLEYNVDQKLGHAIWDLFGKDMILANVRKAQTKGRVEVLNEFNRPYVGNATPTTAPPVTDSKDGMKKSSDAFFEQQKQNY